jgi:quinolinate synthase
VHGAIGPGELEEQRKAHPRAELMIHPECRCVPEVMALIAQGGDPAARLHVLSTGGMLEHARRSEAQELIVATEIGMLHPLRRQSPGKRFIPAQEAALCQYMKLITLPKLRDSLRDLRPQVRVAPQIAARARKPIERMLAIS